MINFFHSDFFVEASGTLESGIKLIALDYFESTYYIFVYMCTFFVYILYINGLSDLLNLCMGGQFSNEKIGLSTFLIKITRKIVKEKCWWNFDMLFSKEERNGGTVDWPLKIQTSNLFVQYGITGCGIFKAGIQNWKGFCIKINRSQMKILNFENWTNGEPQ